MKTNHLLTAAIAILAAPILVAKDAPKPPEKAGGGKVEKVAVKPYPLDTCIVSDEKLGAMGEPVSFVYQGQEIKLCCKGCRKDFDKEPAKYLKKLEKAAKK